jgi:hypothetical protein
MSTTFYKSLPKYQMEIIKEMESFLHLSVKEREQIYLEKMNKAYEEEEQRKLELDRELEYELGSDSEKSVD